MFPIAYPGTVQPIDFSSIPRRWPQTESSFPRRFPVWRTCFLDGWRLSEGSPVECNRLTNYICEWPGKPLQVYCRHRRKHSESLSRVRRTVGIDRKTASHTPKPFRNGTSGYELTRWQTVENDWINFTRLDCVTSETCRRIFSTVLG